MKSSQKRVHIFPLSIILFVMLVTGKLLIARLDEDINRLEITISTIQYEKFAIDNKTTELKNELTVSETDEYIASQARKLYDYLMPGEIRFVVSNPEALNGEPEVSIVESRE